MQAGAEDIRAVMVGGQVLVAAQIVGDIGTNTLVGRMMGDGEGAGRWGAASCIDPAAAHIGGKPRMDGHPDDHKFLLARP